MILVNKNKDKDMDRMLPVNYIKKTVIKKAHMIQAPNSIWCRGFTLRYKRSINSIPGAINLSIIDDHQDDHGKNTARKIIKSNGMTIVQDGDQLIIYQENFQYNSLSMEKVLEDLNIDVDYFMYFVYTFIVIVGTYLSY